MSNVVTFPGSSTGRAPASESPNKPSQEMAWRSREHVQSSIKEHRAAWDRYAQAVAWVAAVESGNLPVGQIEAAKQDLAELHAEMDYCARMLLVCMPTDVKALIELLLYLERNFTILPQEIRHAGVSSNSLAFDLLRTVRLSLREVLKANKSSL
ncbi:hypothetical protein [Nitrobacter vulgaris]|uniref:Uncharacterized protein n=1 Tax=Nitrobacter vulgaris TaxID=29421 RepID=A0A1V4HYN4_NITVU|nr:hypothetical protein [Nitrobacter vulgaris]OPH82979.1 hypothetical protein B2M20_10735 [Nitrobacter vulgaris]